MTDDQPDPQRLRSAVVTLDKTAEYLDGQEAVVLQSAMEICNEQIALLESES